MFMLRDTGGTLPGEEEPSSRDNDFSYLLLIDDVFETLKVCGDRQKYGWIPIGRSQPFDC